MALTHSDVDEVQVSHQLGREVRGHWSVAARCHLGVSTVIENHPVVDGKPFPTLFWLTCPLLVKRVSKQEAAGRMTELNERLAADDALRQRLASAIDALRERRDTHAEVQDSGSPPGGGPDRVKCLHAHVAQELAMSPNAIGSIALSETGFPDCVRPCVEQAG